MYHQKNNCVTIIVCYIITAGAFHTTAAFSRIPSRPADGDTTLYCSNSSAHMPDEWDAALYCGNGSAHMSDEGEAAPYYGTGSTRLTGGTVFTLKDCMEYALANSADIRIQQADNDDRQTARRDAILAAFTPSISADAAAYSNFGRAVDPETNTYITTASFNNAWSVSAGITLFNGFQAVNNLRITKTAKAMGISQEQQIRDRICLATIEAYYNAVYYSKLTDIIASCVKTAEDVLRMAARQEELGQKSHSDVVQAKAELADREYQLTNARNSLTDAFITLKAIMFWPITEPLEIDCEEGMQDRMPCYAESLPDMSGPAGNRTAYLHGNRTVLTDGSKGDTTTGIIRNAIGFLPAASIAKGNMENARMELRTAKWRLAPSLSLFYGFLLDYFCLMNEYCILEESQSLLLSRMPEQMRFSVYQTYCSPNYIHGEESAARGCFVPAPTYRQEHPFSSPFSNPPYSSAPTTEDQPSSFAERRPEQTSGEEKDNVAGETPTGVVIDLSDEKDKEDNTK